MAPPQDMEAGLKKMQLAKRIGQTKANNDKSVQLSKKSMEIGEHFVPLQVRILLVWQWF